MGSRVVIYDTGIKNSAEGNAPYRSAPAAIPRDLTVRGRTRGFLIKLHR